MKLDGWPVTYMGNIKLEGGIENERTNILY